MPQPIKNPLPKVKSNGGRPPKFDGPSRPITLTLPERTLDDLSLIHEDRGQAIVKLTESALKRGKLSHPQVEVVEMASNTGLIVVGPSVVLKKIKFLHLVEVAPSRFILALEPGHDFRSLEIAINDVLDEMPDTDTRERELIADLLSQIRKLRKSERVSMAEILLVRLNKAIGRQMNKAMEFLVVACTVFA